jgi:uracil-DNA glycosylase
VSRRSFVSSWSAGFVETLAAAQIGETYNFYREGDGAARRRERLRAYLDSRIGARYLLVGEAPGYRGTLVSGVPFTSERQLSGNAPGEATATVVHRVLVELGIENDVLLWNLVPTHPRRPGEPRSNRRPTQAEIADGAPFLAELAHQRLTIPVGRLAQARLGGPYVRHPSHGGARVFRRALVDFVRG